MSLSERDAQAMRWIIAHNDSVSPLVDGTGWHAFLWTGRHGLMKRLEGDGATCHAAVRKVALQLIDFPAPWPIISVLS